MTNHQHVAFATSWKNRVRTTLGGVKVAVLSAGAGDFVKKAVGRAKAKDLST